MKMISFSIILIWGLLASQLAISQDNSAIQDKNEVIHEQVHQQLTDNETLVLLEENKELILDDSESDWDIIKSIPEDAWKLIKAPVGWDKRQWFIASGVVTITTMMMVGDKAVADFVQDNKTEFTEDVAYWAEKGGSQAYVGLAASYVIGTMLKNKKLKKSSILAFSSMLISGIVVQGLKNIIGRTRPYASENQWQFTGINTSLSSSRMSFPSGHTAAAFSVAAAISTVYDNQLVSILAYTAATLTGLSRIHDNKHWMSDVFMGSIIGIATGNFIAKQHMSVGKNPRVNIAPARINLGGQTVYGAGITINIGSGKKNRKKRHL